MTTRGSRLVTGNGHRNVVGRRRLRAGRASSGPGVGLGWSAERWRQVGGREELTHGPWIPAARTRQRLASQPLRNETLGPRRVALGAGGPMFLVPPGRFGPRRWGGTHWRTCAKGGGGGVYGTQRPGARYSMQHLCLPLALSATRAVACDSPKVSTQLPSSRSATRCRAPKGRMAMTATSSAHARHASAKKDEIRREGRSGRDFRVDAFAQ